MEPGKVYHIYTHANGFENLFRSQENYRYFLERYSQFIPSVADTLTFCLMPNHIHFLVRIKTKAQIIDYFNLSPLIANSSEISNLSPNSSEVSTLSRNSSEVSNLLNKNLGGITEGGVSNLPPNSYGVSNLSPNSSEVSTLSRNSSEASNLSPNSSEVSNLLNKNLGGMSKAHTLGGLNEAIDELVEKRISQQFSNLFNAYTKAFNNMYGRKGSLFIHRFKRKEVKDDTYFTTVICYIHRNPIHHGFAKTLTEWPWSSYKLILENKSSIINASEIIGWFGNLEQYISKHQYSLDSLIDFD